MSPPTRRTPPDQGGARKIRTAPDPRASYLTDYVEGRERVLGRRHPEHRPERLAPHDLAAEDAVLGAMLLRKSAADRAIELVDVDDFYRQTNAYIFEAIRAVVERGDRPDAVLVAAVLRVDARLDAIGGSGRLLELAAACPGFAVDAYAAIVVDAARRRRVIDCASQVIEAAHHGAGLEGLVAQLAEVAK